MKKTDLAYIAGVFDGEGCVNLGKCGNTYKARITIGNTNEWLIQRFKFQFGGNIRMNKGRDNRKDFWIWSLNCQQSARFLKLILPYLTIKRPQAQLLIEYEQARHHRGYNEEELAIQEAQRILMRKYNKKGVV